MLEKINISCIQEFENDGVEYEVERNVIAVYVKDGECECIIFVNDRGVIVDFVEQEDCDPGITLEMIWEDLKSKLMNNWLNVTDVEIK